MKIGLAVDKVIAEISRLTFLAHPVNVRLLTTDRRPTLFITEHSNGYNLCNLSSSCLVQGHSFRLSRSSEWIKLLPVGWNPKWWWTGHQIIV